jgi:hypothetical protein
MRIWQANFLVPVQRYGENVLTFGVELSALLLIEIKLPIDAFLRGMSNIKTCIH